MSSQPTVYAELSTDVVMFSGKSTHETKEFPRLGLDDILDYKRYLGNFKSLATSKPSHNPSDQIFSRFSKLVMNFPNEGVSYTDQKGETHQITSISVDTYRDTPRKLIGQYIHTDYPTSVTYGGTTIDTWSDELQAMYAGERAVSVRPSPEVTVSTDGQYRETGTRGGSIRGGRSRREKPKVYHN